MRPKSISFLGLAAVTFASATGKNGITERKTLRFVPLNEEEQRRLGSGGGYGYFADDSLKYCLELPRGDADNFAKLWINKCNPGKKKQLWKPDGDFDTGFVLRSGVDNDMCVEVRKKNQEGASLRLNKCRRKKSVQKWVFDGDFLSPEKGFGCAYPRNGRYRKFNAMVLVDCGDIPDFDSWDFVTDEEEFNSH
uniref:Ricin B lectin domain-containing protein n=1 Tax=Pseudictyota dubia TaxID=2749911 RepID=A0A7R9W8R3_9STRA|mmetsp:Transcript_39108/g.72239  ORF Transcript_39108/g.72239 Transcript_39108/m.72239 type:complete len:193 (+) Transcript_39108:133-711(+)|eukprot:CAMPEP_0197451262 /NCGR_PEP_ID=MMETSP1175-20131217/28278_1 /TAXON_ID=1003142 /ORGANISM="Triceratium dubium, Strain CCMP147" /LENGTH=192 /DNA_ID=CAMNT_0042983917 /DNA_START=132 /DNA_END=710 /DNA_ORIENTATION=-